MTHFVSNNFQLTHSRKPSTYCWKFRKT